MILNRENISFSNTNYDIILAENFDELPSEIRFSYSKLFLITEKKVAKYYLKEIQSVFKKQNISLEIIYILGGEKNKHIRGTKKVYNELIEKGADRKSIILALGGGVVGDFSGFIASTFLRGIRFIQIPTTLLACVDSSVGGKVAVNVDKGKNMVGAFHQPILVYAALHTLQTLKKKEWKCGLAEIIKHSLLSGNDFFDSLKVYNFIDIKKTESLIYMILESVRFKKSIVSQDEKETGLRGILNLGHTLGHAVESLTQYKKYSHGEAVAQGLVFALILSAQIKNLDKKYFNELLEILQNFKIKSIDKKLKPKDLIAHMIHDKKTSDGHLQFILLDQIGNASWGNKISEENLLLGFKEYQKLA
jgi:3-dehydroquinate synthase